VDTGLLISLLGTIAGIAAVFGAYQIARRSGTFTRPPLRLRVGPLGARGWRYRHPLVVAHGIPVKRFPAHEFVVDLTLQLDAGPETAKNVCLQVFYPVGRDASASPGFLAHYCGNPAPDTHRRTVKRRDGTLVEYSLSSIRRNSTVILTEPLVYRGSEIEPTPTDPSSVRFDEIVISVRADNHPGIDLRLLLAAVQSESAAELKAGILPIGVAACIFRKLDVIVPNRWGYALVPPPRRLWSRRMLCYQLEPKSASLHEKESIIFALDGENTSQVWSVDYLPLHKFRGASGDA